MIGITPGFEDMALLLCQSLAESGPVRVDEFDDAWTPAGENYRDELVSGGLVTIEEDGQRIVLSAAGVAIVAGEAPAAPELAAQP